MPTVLCGRNRASVFNILLGIVIGFSLAYCLIILDYCVVIYKQGFQHPITRRFNITLREPRTEHYHHRLSSSTDKTINRKNCDDKALQRAFKQRGEFWVLYNYVKADVEFSCDETITYSTQGDYTFLDNLPVLAERWYGPMSVALYAPGYDFNATLDSIAYLRNCETGLIRTFVTFHLFFGYKEVPNVGDVPLISLYNDTYNCSKPAPYANINKANTYKEKHKLMHPINIARNIARETVQTHFIFSGDIELYPTRNLIPKFFKMISRYPDLIQNSSVFVLPLFEVTSDQKVPETKAELQNMIRNRTAFVFHEKLCLPCHKIPNGDKWLKTAETTDGLNVFISAKRIGKHKFWEPFYIGTNKEPLFDERLTWEGQSNKMTQAYIMCLLNYNYLVLDNAFLIHKPGIKKHKDQLRNHANMVRSTNKMIHDVIKQEIDTIYGGNKECY